MAAIPMLRVRPSLGTTLVCAAVCLAAASLAAQQVFRGRVDLVRVDVSVIDNRTGKPVTDLKAEDFTVTETGRSQRIDAFAFHGDGALTGAAAPSQAGPLAPHSRRVFMIIFGAPAGNRTFDGPYGVFDGTVRFIRERLRPGDLVGIMAFNRFTELTSDHEAAIRLVQRLKTRHREEYFEKTASTPARGVRADLTAVRQASIDRLIAPPGDSLRLRSATDLVANSYFQTSAWLDWNNKVIDLDALKVHAAIEYLRRAEGNKQIVLFSTRFGLTMKTQIAAMGRRPNRGEEAAFAGRASDAGVALNIINVTGVDLRGRGAAFLLFGVSQIQEMQSIAELSGGHYSGVRTADRQLERLDRATRAGYAIGYSSTNPELDGKFREIKVKVARSGVTVVYRHGYTAGADGPPVDLRELVTAQRLQQAATTDTEFADVPLQARAEEVEGSGGRQVRVTIKIDGARLELEKRGDRWIGEIDVVVFCGTRDQRVAGSVTQRMTLGMDSARYLEATTTGIPVTVTVPVSDRSVSAKVVVYQFASDRVGTAVATIGARR